MVVMRILGGPVFGGVFFVSMPPYHHQHPYQYILVVAVVYGLVATLWVRFFGYLGGWKRMVSIGAVILISLLVASIPGEILWAIHDIQAGSVPPLSDMRRYLIWAGTSGPILGWSIIGTSSILYSFFGCLVGYFVTHFGQRKKVVDLIMVLV